MTTALEEGSISTGHLLAPALDAVMHFLLAAMLAFGLSIGASALVYASQQETPPDISSLLIYTENYPPLNYEEDGEAKGLSVDLLLEMFERAGLKKQRHEVIVVPWARGYTETQKRPNTILFSTVRTPARENLFHWIGPIGISRMVLIAQRDSNMDVEGGLRFNDYRYGVVQHSRGDQALQEAGTDPNQFVYLNSPLSAAHMLARGRVDAWAFERMVAFWVLQKLGYRAQDFRVAHAFKKQYYYFAISLDTDPALIRALQASLESIRKDGTLSAIVEGHIPGASSVFLGLDE